MDQTEFYKKLPRRDSKYPYCREHPDVDTKGEWDSFYEQHKDCNQGRSMTTMANEQLEAEARAYRASGFSDDRPDLQYSQDTIAWMAAFAQAHAADVLAAERSRVCEWTPIKTEDDLPTEGGEYEVTFQTPSGLHVTTRIFYAHWMSIFDSEHRQRLLRQNHWLPSSGQHIIAWRHTPEPYKEAK